MKHTKIIVLCSECNQSVSISVHRKTRIVRCEKCLTKALRKKYPERSKRYKEKQIVADKKRIPEGTMRIDDGYVTIMAASHPNAPKDGWMMYHRIVMEKSLGRLLDKAEVVHHKDGNPLNNDIDNLELKASKGIHLAEEHVWDGVAARRQKAVFCENGHQLRTGYAKCCRCEKKVCTDCGRSLNYRKNPLPGTRCNPCYNIFATKDNPPESCHFCGCTYKKTGVKQHTCSIECAIKLRANNRRLNNLKKKSLL